MQCQNILSLSLLLTFFDSTMYPQLNIQHQPSINYSERINKNKKSVKPEYIIIHYTANCNHKSVIDHFKSWIHKVSAHYVIQTNGTIVETVHPDHAAWHAGKSSWKNNSEMNIYSIGIELINPGFTDKNSKPCPETNENNWTMQDCIEIEGSPNCWYAFSKKQIQSLIELCKDLIQKYHIDPYNILGHSDIAPDRKIDPGPLFPWQLLSQYGIGMWWDKLPELSIQPSIQEIQKKLQDFGYTIKITNKIDAQTTNIIKAFQSHFRPKKIDGMLDTETIAILDALLDKYKRNVLA